MWQVMWLDDTNGRKSIQFMNGFTTQEDAYKWADKQDFQPDEYVTVAQYQ